MSKNDGERLRDTTDSSRRPRAAQTEGERTRDEAREISDDHRIAAFRQRQYQSVLPIPPQIPGYSMCWLTTENSSDSIAERQQQGYELVSWAEVRGWVHANANVEAQDGEPVRVKEMVLAKISERLRNEYMHIAHHEKPLQSDEGILSAVDNMSEKAKRQGTSVEEEEGIRDIRDQMRKKSPFR